MPTTRHCIVRFALLLLLASSLLAQQPERNFNTEFQAGLDALQRKQFEEGIACFERCLELRPQHPTATYNIACAQSLSGNVEGGLEWLGRAIELGWSRPDHLLWDSDLDNLRQTPRFAELLHRAEVLRAAAIQRETATRQAAARAVRDDVTRAEELARLSPILWQDGHGGILIGRARFSPDGELLLTHGADGMIQAWNSRTGEHVAELGRRSHVRVNLDFSADGERIVVFDYNAGQVFLYDGRSLEFVGSLGNDDIVFDEAELSPDGSRLATTDANGQVRVWDLTTGRPHPQPQIDTLPAPGRESLHFSPDGSTLLTVAKDGRARLWDASSGALRHTFGAPGSAVSHAQLTADGQRLVAWTANARTLRIYDLEQPEQPVFEARNTRQNGDAPVSPDGRFVVTRWRTLAGDALKLHDVDNNKVVAELGKNPRFTWVQFSPDGQRLGTRDTTQLRLWDAGTGALVGRVPGDYGGSTWFSPNGKYVLTGKDPIHGTAVLIDAIAGTQVRQLPSGGSINHCDFEPHGDRIVTVSSDDWAVLFTPSGELQRIWGRARLLMDAGPGPDSEVESSLWTSTEVEVPTSLRAWSPTTGLPASPPFAERPDQAGVVGYFANLPLDTPHGRYVTLTGWLGTDGRLNGYLDVFAAGSVTRQQRRALPFAVDRARCSPDGSLLLNANFGGKNVNLEAPIHLYDLKSDEVVAKFAGSVSADNRRSPVPEFHPSGQWIVNAAFAPRTAIEIRDGRTGKLVRTLEGHTDQPRRFVFSPDGRFLVSTSSDATARLWNCATWTSAEPVAHANVVWDAAFSPDGSHFATASEDHTARICTTADPSQQLELTGHSDRIRCVVYHPDGRRVITCSRDCTVRIWDATSGEMLHVLRGHTAEVQHAFFLAAGKRLVTRSGDSTVRLWDPDRGELLLTRVEYVSNNWLAFTPQGYYVASQDAADWARVRVRDETYPLSSYADILQSPERVAAVLAGQKVQAPPPLPKAPELRVSSPRDRNTTTTERSFQLDLLVEDAYGIDSIVVTQDGTAIAADLVEAAIQRSRRGRRHEARLTMKLPIAAGRSQTRVEVRAINHSKIKSRPQKLLITYQKPQNDLYLLAFAVQDYDDDALDLNCPKNDVRDIVAAFEAQEGQLFAKVHTKVLLDDEVTPASLYQLREEFLRRAKRDDTLVVFLAGHGVRTEAEDYWFLTPTATADQPWSGVNRQVIDSLVTWDKLAAKSRLLLMDTCQSGESLAGTRDDSRGRLVSKDSATRMLKESRGGLYVLAASTDRGLAREQDGNGLFTRALLEGLRGGADRNRDGLVQVEELLPFVSDRVHEVSKGRQHPTIPRIDGGQDFVLFRSKR